MMASNDGVSHRVETSLTGLAKVALALGWRIVAPVLGDRWALTRWTPPPVWPAYVTDGFNTLGVVEAGLSVEHGASLAHCVICNKGPRSGQCSA